MTPLAVCEWAGSLFGLGGAFLLATNKARLARAGWLAFLAANVTMIAFAFGIGAHGLLVQQLGFTATSLLGLWRAPRVRGLGLPPALAAEDRP